jgi:hypothetical protein
MKVLEVIDRFFALVWHYPLVLLCRASGKSNFVFARGALWFGSALVCLGIISVEVETHSPIAATNAVMIPIVTTVFALAINRWLGRIEHQAGEVLRLGVPHEILLLARAYMLFWLIFDLAIPSSRIGYYIEGAGHLLIFAALYFSTDFQSPRKSWLRSGAEKLTALSKSLARPRLVPRLHGN